MNKWNKMWKPFKFTLSHDLLIGFSPSDSFHRNSALKSVRFNPPSHWRCDAGNTERGVEAIAVADREVKRSERGMTSDYEMAWRGCHPFVALPCTGCFLILSLLASFIRLDLLSASFSFSLLLLSLFLSLALFAFSFSFDSPRWCHPIVVVFYINLRIVFFFILFYFFHLLFLLFANLERKKKKIVINLRTINLFCLWGKINFVEMS